ncbi:MAG TPA: G1 family glutamic endopeptidase [Gaiellaceae bacterium]|jgi:hypothetical protein
MKRTLLLCLGLTTLGLTTAVAVLAPAKASSRIVYGAAAPRAAAEVSSNWSGYVATGLGSTSTTASPSTQFRNATATWKVPKATCTATGSASASAVWVGLGGYSTSSTALEQTGTSSDCSAEGVPSYYAWWEIVPDPSVKINLKLLPGDVVTGSVVVNGTDVLMQIKNRTRKTVFTKRVTFPSPDLTSAEWIAEAPSECAANGFCRQIPLANFGSVTFTKIAALATIDGLGNQGGTLTSTLWQSTPIQLVPQRARRFYGDVIERPDATTGTAGAAPYGLAADGASFSVAWVSNPTSG